VTKRTIMLRKPQWYRMQAMFEGAAHLVTEINDAEVLLQGVFYEADFPCPKCGTKVHLDRINLRGDGHADLSPQLGICLIPPEAASNAAGEALRRMLEANLRMPVLLLSNNIHMVKLKPIPEAEAKRIMEGAGDEEEGRLVSIPVGRRQAEPVGGEAAREDGGGVPAGGPGPSGSGGGDGGGQGEAQGQTDQGGQVGSDQPDEGAPVAEHRPEG